MPIVFKSAAAADVVFLECTAKEILALLGKDPEAGQGIITPPQLPQAIAVMQAAMATSRGEHKSFTCGPESSYEEDIQPATTLHQQVPPLLSLLDFAHQQDQPVTWGI